MTTRNLTQKLCIVLGFLLWCTSTVSAADTSSTAVDSCNGSWKVELDNAALVRGVLDDSTGQADYYRLDQASAKMGGILYQISDATHVQVEAYTKRATFASVEGNQVSRGFSSVQNGGLCYPMLYAPLQDALFSKTSAGIYRCVLKRGIYSMVPSGLESVSDHGWYGLSFQCSEDGENFRTIPGAITAVKLPNGTYRENFAADLPAGMHYVRLSLSCAPFLTSELNGPRVPNPAEEPLQITKVSFSLNPSKPSASSSSGSSDNTSSEGSSDSAGESSSSSPSSTPETTPSSSSGNESSSDNSSETTTRPPTSISSSSSDNRGFESTSHYLEDMDSSDTAIIRENMTQTIRVGNRIKNSNSSDSTETRSSDSSSLEAPQSTAEIVEKTAVPEFLNDEEPISSAEGTAANDPDTRLAEKDDKDFVALFAGYGAVLIFGAYMAIKRALKKKPSAALESDERP